MHKTLLAVTAALWASQAYATGNTPKPPEPIPCGGTCLDLELRGDMKEGIASAAALAQIDMVSGQTGLGFGFANYGGDMGFAAKYLHSFPLKGSTLTTSIGVFGGERRSPGVAGSVLLSW